MRYISTRHGSQGTPAPLGFEDIMLAGLARDGGLYLPAEWPQFSKADIAGLRGLPYVELAFRIMRPFVGDAFDEATFRRLIGEAYASFETPEVAPLKPLGDSGMHLLELFHGPTLAFKDVALQLLGRMLDHTLTRGNPPDAPQLAPAVGRVIRRTGRRPRTVTADRGYGEQSVEDDLHQLGVRHVVIPRKGKPGKARQAQEHRPAFRRTIKWRTGSEGRISHLKRGYGWDRTRLDGTEGARIWTGQGILAHNLVKIGALAS